MGHLPKGRRRFFFRVIPRGLNNLTFRSASRSFGCPPPALFEGRMFGMCPRLKSLLRNLIRFDSNSAQNPGIPGRHGSGGEEAEAEDRGQRWDGTVEMRGTATANVSNVAPFECSGEPFPVESPPRHGSGNAVASSVQGVRVYLVRACLRIRVQ